MMLKYSFKINTLRKKFCYVILYNSFILQMSGNDFISHYFPTTFVKGYKFDI